MAFFDYFNSTSLMFLATFVIAIGLLCVYFESKIREQNHKLSAMLSLVSTLAEDVNGVKIGLHHCAIAGVGGGHNFRFQPPLEQTGSFLNIKKENVLIEVSDDEESVSDNDADEESVSDNDAESVSDNDAESVSDNDAESVSDNDADEESVSVSDEDKLGFINEDEFISDDEVLISGGDKGFLNFLKIVQTMQPQDSLSTGIIINNLDIEMSEDLNDLNDLEAYIVENVDEPTDINEADLNEADLNEADLNASAKCESDIFSFPDENIKDDIDILESTLKTIHINLEDSTTTELVDYAKLPLTKLRSVVSEKGLSSDTSKIKKQELLKLLGV